MTNGKWSYKRVTSLYILNCAIFYAFVPLFYKDFDVKEFVFVALLGYSATMVGVNAWEKRNVFKDKKEEEINSEGQ